MPSQGKLYLCDWIRHPWCWLLNWFLCTTAHLPRFLHLFSSNSCAAAYASTTSYDQDQTTPTIACLSASPTYIYLPLHPSNPKTFFLQNFAFQPKSHQMPRSYNPTLPFLPPLFSSLPQPQPHNLPSSKPKSTTALFTYQVYVGEDKPASDRCCNSPGNSSFPGSLSPSMTFSL